MTADFADGAYFVSLAALRRPEDVPAAVVKALAIVVLSGESADQAAERFLAAKHLLLVLDNFEHVLAAAPFIGRLLEACPALTVLATSREPLDAAGRGALPGGAARAAARATREDADAAGRRGRRRAVLRASARPRPRLRPRRCQRAPRSRRSAGASTGCRWRSSWRRRAAGCCHPARSPQRLDDALGALGSGARDAPARQQTLRATIDWSHELLSDAEKQCFARFAVFAGGATVEAAETITAAGLDTLDGLVAKSLLVRRRHAHAPTRLGMLETIRAYAAERFAAAADGEAVREDHYRYYLALAQRHGAERALSGRRRPGAPRPAGRRDRQPPRGARLGDRAGRAPNARSRMAAALGCYWVMRNRYADAVDWIDQALNLPGADAHPALRVRALCTKARCLWQVGRGAEQPAIMAEAEAIARRLGDPVILSQVLQRRVHHEIDAERLDVADALADEALHWARAAGDDWEIAEASRGKAIAASSIADLRERVDTAAALLTDVGNVHRAREPAHRRRLLRALSRQRARRSGLRRPRDSDRARAGQSVRADDQQRQPRPGCAADR